EGAGRRRDIPVRASAHDGDWARARGRWTGRRRRKRRLPNAAATASGHVIDMKAASAAMPTIHVVDDDAPFRTAIGRLLEASGYQVVLHGSAEQLLAHVTLTEPGCILLDVRMPGLSGPQLQSRLIELGNKLPIVF